MNGASLNHDRSDTEGLRLLKDQVARLEAKLGLTFSYENKIRALEDRLDTIQNGADSDFDRELQRSSIFKEALLKTQSNLIGNFDRLQLNIQTTLQRLNTQLSGMEDNFLEMFHQNERELTRLSRLSIEHARRVEVLEQSQLELAKLDRNSAMAAFESMIQLKIDKSINETAIQLNSIEAELHRSQARLRQDIKGAAAEKQLNETRQTSKDKEPLERMLEDITQRVGVLTNKLAAQDKTIASNKQLLDSTRGQLIKSNQTNENSLSQVRAQITNVKDSLRQEMDKLSKHFLSKGTEAPVGLSAEPIRTNNNQTSLDSLDRIDSARGTSSQLPQQVGKKNPLPPPRTFLGPSTTQSKDIMISEEMTPPHSVSRFDEPQKDDYIVGIRGLRGKSKDKEPYAVSINKQAKPMNIFNPPKPRRNLPPVQADQKLTHKEQMRRVTPEQYLNSSEEEEEEFYVNEDGYIINQQGQLIVDKWGQPIPFPTDGEDDQY